VDVGVAVPIDALQQQISIQEQRSSLEQLRQDELEARASLALLLGRSVQGFEVQGSSLEQITVPALQPGIPSGLLRRRPDLVEAEAILQRAVAGVELARLDFFPRITLTGNASAASTSLTELLTSPDSIVTFSAGLTQTLLDNGLRGRELEQSRLTLENRLNDYRRTVLQAFNDVDVLLNDIEVLREQEQVAQENLAAAEESFRIAQLRYQEGVVDYQTVLTTQDTLFSSRTAYLSSKIQLLNAMVALYQALGGGWNADDRDTMSIAG
jgi:outer membrane protein TolC